MKLDRETRHELAMLRMQLLTAQRGRLAALQALEASRIAQERLSHELEARDVELALMRAEGKSGVSVTELSVDRTLAALCEAALALEGGTVSRAARRLGVDVSTLWRWRNGRTRRGVRRHLPERVAQGGSCEPQP